MNTSDITSAKMGTLQSAVSLAMLKKNMNQEENAAATLIAGMTSANPVSSAPRGRLDIRA